MDRQDILKRLLYPKCKTAIEFKFDNLIVNPMLSYITLQDITQLNKIATSLKYSSKPKEKYAMIDSIMTNRGFKKMASGTNRVTYRCLNDYRVVLKIAIDKVGLSDNGNEYRNQHLLKPFVTKCFEVSPCGTVGLFERVVPITSREEFINISDDIFELINNLIGKYVLEDIGEKFYMNYGLREGFGPVLLDYPYVFELDGRKLICNVPEPMEPKGYCGGEIDYDIGYNNLICTKCGKRYLATELKSDIKSDKPKIIIEGDDSIMRCVLKRGDEVVSKLNSETHIGTNTIKPKKEFVNLKAKLSVKTEEEKDEFKPTIKTSDDVQLVARIRNVNTNKSTENNIEEPTGEKISIDLSSTSEEPIVEEDYFVAKLSEGTHKEYDEVFIDKENHHRENLEKELTKIPTFTAYIKNDVEIWNADTDELVGYVNREQFEGNIEQESLINANCIANERSINESEESNHPTIQDLMNNNDVKVNENYKTTDIIAPIENHFSTTTDKVEEVVEEPIVQEEKEIPELIIHPREKDEEVINSDEEEYDPEYDDQENSESEESDENKIDLY